MDFALEVLAGLPAYGPPATSFSPAGKQLHSEGLVVRFTAGDGASWVGNFQRGGSDYDRIPPHPNKKDALIIASGQGYIVDPVKHRLVGFLDGEIVDLFDHPSQRAVVLNQQNLSFAAIGATGNIWQSRRISWDGFRSLTTLGTKLSGEAWRPHDDEWRPFVLDLETGEVVGGSYPSPPLDSPTRNP
jgi:hypothetical protein